MPVCKITTLFVERRAIPAYKTGHWLERLQGSIMYDIGDKIVYPMHGAGIIEGIEDRVILGQKRKYYIMRVSSSKMKVMIPMENTDEIGVRNVIAPQEAKKVLEYFKKTPVSDDQNWNKRQRENMIKIKSGDIYQVSSVLKDLMYRDKSKGLSISERKMLNNTRQILVSELVMSGFAVEEDIETIMDDIVDTMLFNGEEK